MQPGRNGGKLLVGGVHANAGRPPSELRAQMRGSLAQRIVIAEKIADNPKSSDSDRLRALDFLAKYGMGTTVTETDPNGEHAEKVIRVIREDRPLRRDGSD
jgi:hypothetical protein